MRKPCKKYTAFEKALLLLPKLSVVECLLLRDAIDEPGSIPYIKHSLKHQRYSSWQRTLDPNAPVQISEEDLGVGGRWPAGQSAPSYGRWVRRKFRPFSKETVKKYQRQLTITPLTITDNLDDQDRLVRLARASGKPVRIGK